MTQESFKILTAAIPVSMYLGKENAFSQQRISDIINAIENYQGHKKVISMVSAYTGEGCSELTFGLGMALSRSGKRVLIVDSNPSDQGVFREMRYNLPVSLQAAVQNIAQGNYTVLQMTGTNLFYASFFKNAEDQNIMPKPERLEAFLSVLRDSFDYVIVIAESNAGLSIAKAAQISDISVVVVEAERTRRPVVAQVIDAIQSNSGTLLGLVLNKRPLYIPPIIYSLFYK